MKTVKIEDITCPIKVPVRNHLYAKRCVYHTGTDGICPVHGNVVEYLKIYRKTGQLTEEAELPPKLEPKRDPPTLKILFKEFTQWAMAKLVNKLEKAK